MKKRSIAFLLSLVMLLSLLTPTALAEEPDQEGQATEESTESPALSETTVAVPREAAFGDETTVTAPEGAESYQWQFRLMEDLWVNISGDESAAIVLTYAKVCNMLDESGAASLRCLVDGAASETLTVTVTDEPAQEPDETPVPDEEPVLDEEPVAQPVLPVLDPQQSAEDTIVGVSNGAVGVQEETGDGDMLVVEIKYQFVDGKSAGQSWKASVAKGSSLKQSVKNPVVEGYDPYVEADTEPSESVELNLEDIQKNVEILVTYRPAVVNFTVEHYLQNVGDDKYTLDKTVTTTGYTESPVGDALARSYPGFYALLYDTTTKIAADGSTTVKIYYDRAYYLMNFDLDGGYGVEPIYARYDTPINDVGVPTKAGYTFQYWMLDGARVNIPGTMPAENRKYKAVWAMEGHAKVTVVFWGENADDEDYSYISSKQIELETGKEFTYSEDGMRTCGKEEHIHDADCYKFICTKTEHQHDLSCYADVGSAFSIKLNEHWVSGTEENGMIGESEVLFFGGTGKKYIYYNGTWYRYTGSTAIGSAAPTKCGENAHTHTDLGGACYELICVKEEHTHNSDCYMGGAGLDQNLWTFVGSDTVTIAPDGSSVVNVYYDRTEKTLTFKYDYRSRDYRKMETITAKWGSDISTAYKSIAVNAGSTFWTTSSGGEGPYTNYFGVMPQKSATYYNRGASGSSGTMTYWGEALDGSYTVKLFEVTGVGGYTVTDEDRYEFDGFTFHHGTDNNESCSGATFYYTRNSYKLTFNDGYDDVKSEQVKFEAPLSIYADYRPSVPKAYEAGSRVFGGWYLNPECTGEEYKLSDHTMPADNVLLYAKWVPVTHEVKLYPTEADMKAQENQIGETMQVPHGSVANKPDDPTNGEYQFIGWFYQENGVEKAFDFSMPVNKDLNLYAKWSSNVMVTCVIHYMVAGTTTKVAEDFVGKALATTTQTFEAKTGTALFEAYQNGYYPDVSSHSIVVDIDPAKNEFTFYYTPAEKMPYTVRYRELGNESNIIYPDETRDKNTDSIVTERFKPKAGYVPDEVQKRLILTSDPTKNVLTFWYIKDETHAPVQVIDYKQNLDGTYTESVRSSFNGNIRDKYSDTALSFPGFTFNEGKSTTNGTIEAEGLILKFYYDRNSYPYEFKFVLQGTTTELADSEKGSALYQSQVTQNAKNIPGYEVVGAKNYSIIIQIEDPDDVANKNVRIFYYTEKTATINYEVVGPKGCGSVTPTSETVKVVTGEAQGSTAAANGGFRFVGWYDNANCTGTALSDNPNYVPTKPGDLWTDATYYAKFEPDVADLTITKTGCADIDENQSFIFTVKGEGLPTEGLKVVVTGNGSVTITGLKVGTTYTITEDTGWSWRYEVKSGEQNPRSVEVKGGAVNEIIFANNREMDKWLNGCSIEVNNWKKKAGEESPETN